MYDYRYENGAWSQHAELSILNGYIAEDGGFAVALSETTAMMSAYRAEVNGIPSGVVQVYSLVNDEWSYGSSLSGDGLDGTDYFGSYLSIYGDTAVISNKASNSNKGMLTVFLLRLFVYIIQGVVYFYEFISSSWSLQSTIIAPNGESGEMFGFATGLHKSNLFVTTYLTNQNVYRYSLDYVPTAAPTISLTPTLEPTSAPTAYIYGITVTMVSRYFV